MQATLVHSFFFRLVFSDIPASGVESFCPVREQDLILYREERLKKGSWQK